VLSVGTDADGEVGRVDPLNRWYEEFVATPLGAILLFALIFITRLALDEYARRRARKGNDRWRRPKGS
jgi:hypothetical protein